MNKRKVIFWLGIPTLVVGMWASTVIPSEAAQTSVSQQPGSVNDPIVTKSYVDQTLKQMVADEVAKTNQQLMDQLKNSQGGSSDKLVVVKLKKSQTLYAGVGTEFIVRTGHVLAVSSDTNGIPDLTGGKDVAPGHSIDLNHLLLFPRTGRGIKPNSKYTADIYVMIKGSYSIFENGKRVYP